MKRWAWATPAVASLLVLPLFAAALLTAAQTPAIATAIQCSTAASLPTGTWRPPFEQAYALTSGFGQRYDPIYHRWQLHTGQDLVSLPTPGPVVAAAAGTVISAGADGGYGNAVVLDNGGGVRTLYGHLASIDPAITARAVVWIGQRLGVEGSTGASTGNHLHYEVQIDGTPVDPVPFMLDHGAPLNGQAIAPSDPPGSAATGGGEQGGIGFPLPPPGTPRLESLHTSALPIPAAIKTDYLAAADRYKVPWTLLAGIGMEETGQGRNEATSSAGAQGLMQFMPATWAAYGVDGSGDGIADIHNDADSAMSAANYLTALGATTGGVDGVRRAIYGYNHADWYVNDVLLLRPGLRRRNHPRRPRRLRPRRKRQPRPPVHQQRRRCKPSSPGPKPTSATPIVYGANGPSAWDCSSFTQAAYAHIGITIPRTASAQHDWLAHGNGYRVPLGQERPGDLIFTDSYLGPNVIGHVMIVYDPARHLTIEAGGTHVGNYNYTQWESHRLFSIWRVGAVG